MCENLLTIDQPLAYKTPFAIRVATETWSDRALVTKLVLKGDQKQLQISRAAEMARRAFDQSGWTPKRAYELSLRIKPASVSIFEDLLSEQQEFVLSFLLGEEQHMLASCVVDTVRDWNNEVVVHARDYTHLTDYALRG